MIVAYVRHNTNILPPVPGLGNGLVQQHQPDPLARFSRLFNVINARELTPSTKRYQHDHDDPVLIMVPPRFALRVAQLLLPRNAALAA